MKLNPTLNFTCVPLAYNICLINGLFQESQDLRCHDWWKIPGTQLTRMRKLSNVKTSGELTAVQYIMMWWKQSIRLQVILGISLLNILGPSQTGMIHKVQTDSELRRSGHCQSNDTRAAEKTDMAIEDQIHKRNPGVYRKRRDHFLM